MSLKSKVGLLAVLILSSQLSLIIHQRGFSCDGVSKENEKLPKPVYHSEFSIPEEEFKQAQEVSYGLCVTPSEEETKKFIEKERLDLLGTGQQSAAKAPPRIGLSIDGGGLRGLMSALWLKDLHVAYQEEGETGIHPRLHQIFDYVGGTSIGGIIALGVAADKNPDDIVNLFAQHGHRIFSTEGRKLVRFADFLGLFGYRYTSNNLESLMKEVFGETHTFDSHPSTQRTQVLVTACTDDGHPWLFRRDDERKYKLWEIARSTSAAPTYFKAYKPTAPGVNDQKALVDGGIWINNPTTLVTAGIVKYYHSGNFDPKNIHILSLGTGDTDAKAIPLSAGKLSVSPILEALMNSHNRGNHMMMTQLLGDHYHRINPTLRQFIDLSDVKAIPVLRWYAQQPEHTAQLKTFVDQTKDIVRHKLDRGY